MADEDVPVLIIGGSLVGLSTSLFLAQHDVDHLVVERHPGTAIHPRAAGFLQRTIETYRSAGIQDEVIAASEKEFLQNGAIMAVKSLAGEELEWYFRSINDGVEHLSPSPRLFITQIGLEPVLKERAAELGARLEYGAEVTGLETDSGGATAVVVDRETGNERKVMARYVVAADGTHSPIRGAARCRDAGPRELLGQHHDLLPRRRQRADRRPEPERGLRVRSARAGLLPLLARRPDRLPRGQLGCRRRRRAVAQVMG